MNKNFAAIVEDVQNLSTEEKEELRALLENYLVEARREEVYKDYLDSRKRVQRAELDFSSDVEHLRKTLEEG
jgi:hypothetical protein